jgi:hypothetical protein
LRATTRFGGAMVSYGWIVRRRNALAKKSEEPVSRKMRRNCVAKWALSRISIRRTRVRPNTPGGPSRTSPYSRNAG